MSWLMVALIGPGKGPKVPVSKRKSVVRVSGMNDGQAHLFVDEEQHIVIEGNGNYPLPSGEFAHVEYKGSCMSFIAEIARET